MTYVVSYLRNPNPTITNRLLRAFGATIGSKTTFKRGILIDNSYEDQASTGNLANLVVGDDCYIGDDVYFDLSNKIIIEDTAVISGRVSFITHADCNRSEFLNAAFPRRCAPIRVGRGAWLGFSCILLAGVEVGENVLVASSALLTTNAKSYCVYAGIPATCKRDLAQIGREL
jgi:acetyltransferase-like isoleucine patch superfamily enzyme